MFRSFRSFHSRALACCESHKLPTAHGMYCDRLSKLASSKANFIRSGLPALACSVGVSRSSYRSLRAMSTSSHQDKKHVPESFYDLSPLDNRGQPYPFNQLKGKVVLIVNVASKCGFTKQYKDLEQLYSTYKDQGLVILGFPCNQFGGQEPGSDTDIATFCSVNFGVTFPVLKKIEVNGSHADPVYQFLKSKKSGFLGFSGIKWNFEKFLVNSDGEVVSRFSSATNPSSLTGDIEALLKSAK